MQAKILILPDCTGADLHRSLVEKKRKVVFAEAGRKKYKDRAKLTYGTLQSPMVNKK